MSATYIGRGRLLMLRHIDGRHGNGHAALTMNVSDRRVLRPPRSSRRTTRHLSDPRPHSIHSTPAPTAWKPHTAGVTSSSLSWPETAWQDFRQQALTGAVSECAPMSFVAG